MSTKIRSLEEEKATITTHPDFDLRDDLRTNEAFIASEITHLEKARANEYRDTFRAKLLIQGEKPGGAWSKLGKLRRPRDPICYRLDKRLNCLAVSVTLHGSAVRMTRVSYMSCASVRGLAGGHQSSRSVLLGYPCLVSG